MSLGIYIGRIHALSAHTGGHRTTKSEPKKPRLYCVHHPNATSHTTQDCGALRYCVNHPYANNHTTQNCTGLYCINHPHTFSHSTQDCKMRQSPGHSTPQDSYHRVHALNLRITETASATTPISRIPATSRRDSGESPNRRSVMATPQREPLFPRPWDSSSHDSRAPRSLHGEHVSSERIRAADLLDAGPRENCPNC